MAEDRDDVKELRDELDRVFAEREERRLAERDELQEAAQRAKTDSESYTQQAEARIAKQMSEFAAEVRAFKRDAEATMRRHKIEIERIDEKNTTRAKKLLARVEGLVEAVEQKIGQAEDMARTVRDDDAGLLAVVQELEQRVEALEALVVP